jgi:hypothetical protein
MKIRERIAGIIKDKCRQRGVIFSSQLIADLSADEIIKVVEEMLPGYGEIAVMFHDYYEKIAKEVGWKTQDGCGVPFNNLPDKNKQVMLKVADKVLAEIIRRLRE